MIDLIIFELFAFWSSLSVNFVNLTKLHLKKSEFYSSKDVSYKIQN